MNALNTLFYCVSAITIIALPFLIVNWVRYAKGRSNQTGSPGKIEGIPLKSTLFFVIPILIAIAIAQFTTSFSRDEVLQFMQNLSGSYTVYVNNQPARDPDKVIAAVKKVDTQLAHHSHPTERIRVEIKAAQGDLVLELGRDSESPQEYWVYYPKYGITSNNEIGRITTPVFDEY